MSISCGQHGDRGEAIVCRHHLAVQKWAVGFVENSGDPSDLQAWCDECEEFFVREGEKTEAFVRFNDFAVVCVDCYASMKARHSRADIERDSDRATLAEMRTTLGGARDGGVLVRVHRTVEAGYARGYVVDVGQKWVALSVVADLIVFDGFLVCRLEDVSSVDAPARNAAFVERALRLRGQTRPRDPGIDLGDISAVLRSAAAAYPLIAVHREVIDPDVCHVGSVERIVGERLVLRLVSADGEWLEEHKSFHLQDITRVDFGGLYEEALSLAAHDGLSE